MNAIIETSIERARRILHERFGGKKAGMAKAAGLSLGTLREIDSDDWNPTAATLRVLEALDLDTTASP